MNMISFRNKSVFNVSENSGSDPRKAQIGIDLLNSL